MRVRLLRGQVVIREADPSPSRTIWTPTPGQRQVTTHRGTVLAVGPCACDKYGNEVPIEVRVGDLVQYHFTHNQAAWTRAWPPDGRPATWVPQANIDAVITCGGGCVLPPHPPEEPHRGEEQT